MKFVQNKDNFEKRTEIYIFLNIKYERISKNIKIHFII